ncbi:putative esterase afoC [Aspergillus mulundensis]|uniref:Putative esterase afoC n=1 Tax=Aspergillus mulundensis TaxID=1810919 RepID=A0A3D8RS85_9EURO|nr:putative esterase afoC [Aspergillus mulundensis]RDW76681.1 putative esterase afoC [Aspergillus mulundensis]
MPALDLDLPPPSEADADLHLPRILCLHGGGTNARIFSAQCRGLRRLLGPSYRLVFADAPFLSSPGPDVTSVYGEWGPFRSWVPVPTGVSLASWAAAGVEVQVDARAIDGCVAAAMERDEKAGARGEWVGLLGFSQGARVAASLLYRQQQQRALGGWSRKRGAGAEAASTNYRFAILFAGRGPLLDLGFDSGTTSASSSAPASAYASASASASESESGSDPDSAAEDDDENEVDSDNLLRIPTIHIHGLRDPGLPMHRDLVRCCADSSVRVVEWDGAHRMPITTKDVGAVVAALRDLAMARKYESLR